MQEILADHTDPAALKADLALTTKSAGVFNLPVCQIPDKTAVPWYGDEVDKAWVSYYEVIPCTCLSDWANYTDPVTGAVSFFRDVAGEAIVKDLKTGPIGALPDRAIPSQCPGVLQEQW